MCKGCAKGNGKGANNEKGKGKQGAPQVGIWIPNGQNRDISPFIGFP